MIAKLDADETQGMAAKDRIFWSDAYKRPLVGPDKGEQIPINFNSPTACLLAPIRPASESKSPICLCVLGTS